MSDDEGKDTGDFLTDLLGGDIFDFLEEVTGKEIESPEDIAEIKRKVNKDPEFEKEVQEEMRKSIFDKSEAEDLSDDFQSALGESVPGFLEGFLDNVKNLKDLENLKDSKAVFDYEVNVDRNHVRRNRGSGSSGNSFGDRIEGSGDGLEDSHEYDGETGDGRHRCSCGRKFLTKEAYEHHESLKKGGSGGSPGVSKVVDSGPDESPEKEPTADSADESGEAVEPDPGDIDTDEYEDSIFDYVEWIDVDGGWECYVEVGSEVKDIDVSYDDEGNEYNVEGEVEGTVPANREEGDDRDWEWRVTETGYLKITVEE
ncbi:MAG: hypothetical protein ABEK59_04315 [Halobacteria archaeon]